MRYRLLIAPIAQQEIQDFVYRLRQHRDDDFANEQLVRLSFEIGEYVVATPLMWNNFFLTGAPYHGYLFRFGRRTHYWIVYVVHEHAHIVEVLRFWNAS
jgi:hypothetical protein